MTDFQGYLVLFLVWLVSTIMVRAIFSKRRTTAHILPSPLGLPIIGHLHLLSPIPHQALHKLSLRHGPLFRLNLGSVSCVVASSPEMAKEFLKTHESKFLNRLVTNAIELLTYDSSSFLFSPFGTYWKFMKKLVMSELLGGRILHQFASVRHEEIKQLLMTVLKSAKVGEEVDMKGELVRLTNNIISRMTLSQRCSESGDEANKVRQLVDETSKLAGKFYFSAFVDFFGFFKYVDSYRFGKKLKDVHERFDVMMEKFVEDHEEARKKNEETSEGDEPAKDILDLLLDISKDESSEVILTRENIKAFVLDIFTAGTETSALTMEWALSELINHPKVMEKAREEIYSIVGKKRLVQESDIPNLPYLQSILKETLRLHPTVSLIIRKSTETCSILGYNIDANTPLFVNVWAIGRDPKHWVDPLEFRPERFLVEEGSGKSQLDVRGQHYHLLPFGSGKRGCPGASLALQVVQTTLASMIQCFDFKVGGNGDGTVDMKEGVGMAIPRAHPLVCVPVVRLDPLQFI